MPYQPKVHTARLEFPRSRWAATGSTSPSAVAPSGWLPHEGGMLAAKYTLGALFLVTSALMGCSKTSAVSTEAADTPSTPRSLLAVGAALPHLVGIDQSGMEHHLDASVGKVTLVYFYPKDGTPGCTKEACAFRDVWQKFQHAGVSLYGVSRDSREAHAQFATEHKLPFPLISDGDGLWEKAFLVPSRLGMSTRVSFLFDKSGKLAKVYPSVDPGVHAERVLADVASLPK